MAKYSYFVPLSVGTSVRSASFPFAIHNRAGWALMDSRTPLLPATSRDHQPPTHWGRRRSLHVCQRHAYLRGSIPSHALP